MKKATLLALFVMLSKAASSQVDLPYKIGFETNVAVGETILTNASCGAWEGTADVQAYVTNISYTEPVCGYPIPSESHSNVMAFAEGTISNAFNTTAPDPESTTPLEVWIDTMVQPVRQEEEPVGSITNAQVAIYFDTNGYLNVYHGIILDGALGVIPTNKAWSKFETAGSLATDQWARVTIHMKHVPWTEGYGAEVKQSYFRIFLNSVEFSNEYAFASADATTQTGGSWFVCANWIEQKLSTLTLSGSGKLDDLVVTTEGVTFEQSAPSVLVSYAGPGIVFPSGTVSFAASPGNTNFAIAASTYYMIGAVYQGTVGGSSNAVMEAAGKESHELVWSNITGQATLFVQFDPILATNRTPVYWMAGRGLDTNTLPTWDDVALWDEDGDGMLTWEEYYAGTHPVDSNSLLKIVGQTFSNGIPRLVWLSSTEAISPYMVQMSTNLVGGNWSNVAVNVTATPGGTNVLDVTAPASGPGLYRVTITN